MDRFAVYLYNRDKKEVNFFLTNSETNRVIFFGLQYSLMVFGTIKTEPRGFVAPFSK